jgi:hypothetical protein
MFQIRFSKPKKNIQNKKKMSNFTKIYQYTKRTHPINPTLEKILTTCKNYDLITLEERHLLHKHIGDDFNLSYNLFTYVDKMKKSSKKKKKIQKEFEYEQLDIKEDSKENRKVVRVYWNDRLEDIMLCRLLICGQIWFEVKLRDQDNEIQHIQHLFQKLTQRIYQWKWQIVLKYTIEEVKDFHSKIEGYEYECELQLQRKPFHNMLSYMLQVFSHQYRPFFQDQGIMDWNIFRIINEYMAPTWTEMTDMKINSSFPNINNDISDDDNNDTDNDDDNDIIDGIENDIEEFANHITEHFVTSLQDIIDQSVYKNQNKED